MVPIAELLVGSFYLDRGELYAILAQGIVHAKVQLVATVDGKYFPDATPMVISNKYRVGRVEFTLR